MAYKRLRYCSHNGCRNYAEDGSYYCKEHLSGRVSESRSSTTRFQYMYGRKWKGASKQWLSKPEHSWCEKCGKPSELVHHKIEHEGNWDLFWDRNNWQALCWSCHSKHHMEERNGKKG